MSQGRRNAHQKRGPGRAKPASETGYKFIYTEMERPVLINAKTGEFTLVVEGFGPDIKMKLCNIYAVYPHEGGNTALGVKALLLDGNGNRIRVVFDLTDPFTCCELRKRMAESFGSLCEVMGGPACKTQIHRPKDPKNKSYIIEVEFCPEHMQKWIAEHGPVIPTTRDMTPPTKEVSIDVPDLKTVNAMMAKVRLNNNSDEYARAMFKEADIPPLEEPFRKVSSGEKDDIPALEKPDDQAAAWLDVE